jgi:hypothetical protein
LPYPTRPRLFLSTLLLVVMPAKAASIGWIPAFAGMTEKTATGS